MDDMKDRIKAFIIGEVAEGMSLSDIEDDEPLIESGIVDSLGVLRIMAFLDETFGVDLSSGEIRLENFRDLRTICAMCQEQLES